MRRSGMALAAVVLALLVLSLLVVAALHTGYVEQRVGRGTGEAARALEAAEAGLALVLGQWEALAVVRTLAIGDSVVLPVAPLDRRTVVAATVRRVADSLYLVKAEGTSADASGTVLARRKLARVARSRGDAAYPLAQRSWIQVY